MPSIRERLRSTSAIGSSARAARHTAAVLLVAGCSALGPPPMEALTAAALGEAERRWEAQGAESYHLVVRVRAPRFKPAVYDLVVTEGKLATVERDGAALPAEEAGRHDFSVAGLFGLLREDLPLAGVHPVGTAPPIDLRARFDPATGRLERYRRTVGTKRRRVLLVEVLQYEPLATPCLAATA